MELIFLVDYLGERINICYILLVRMSFNNNGTILFVETKRSRFILHPISTNTQWSGVDSILYEKLHLGLFIIQNKKHLFETNFLYSFYSFCLPFL